MPTAARKNRSRTSFFASRKAKAESREPADADPPGALEADGAHAAGKGSTGHPRAANAKGDRLLGDRVRVPGPLDRAGHPQCFLAHEGRTVPASLACPAGALRLLSDAIDGI